MSFLVRLCNASLPPWAALVSSDGASKKKKRLAVIPTSAWDSAC
jgi:hypothetical protein